MDPNIKLTMNKAVNLALRSDPEIDLTAIRVGKIRVARVKTKKISVLKAAINETRGASDSAPPRLDERADLSSDELNKSIHIIPNEVGSYIEYSSSELDDIIFGILKELARLQSKGKDQPPEKRYKYKKFLVGFREVERALNRGELKGIVVSTNLEPVDELLKMMTQLKLDCEAKEVPLVFALSRRRMGKALGKSMKQSLVGIVNLDGVHQPWKQALSLVDSLKLDSS